MTPTPPDLPLDPWVEKAIADARANSREAFAKELLADDIAISQMAKAIHDGPLLADEYEYRADTKAGGWCVDCVRAAILALLPQTGGDQ
ncbi:MAG: hypothetical protein AAF679_03735 [Pseudomonadota bacterium]